MITVKTDQEIAIMRDAGRRLGAILSLIKSRALPGVCIAELDGYAEK